MPGTPKKFESGLSAAEEKFSGLADATAIDSEEDRLMAELASEAALNLAGQLPSVPHYVPGTAAQLNPERPAVQVMDPASSASIRPLTSADARNMLDFSGLAPAATPKTHGYGSDAPVPHFVAPAAPAAAKRASAVKVKKPSFGAGLKVLFTQAKSVKSFWSALKSLVMTALGSGDFSTKAATNRTKLAKMKASASVENVGNNAKSKESARNQAKKALENNLKTLKDLTRPHAELREAKKALATLDHHLRALEAQPEVLKTSPFLVVVEQEREHQQKARERVASALKVLQPYQQKVAESKAAFDAADKAYRRASSEHTAAGDKRDSKALKLAVYTAAAGGLQDPPAAPHSDGRAGRSTVSVASGGAAQRLSVPGRSMSIVTEPPTLASKALNAALGISPKLPGG